LASKETRPAGASDGQKRIVDVRDIMLESIAAHSQVIERMSMMADVITLLKRENAELKKMVEKK